MNFTGFPPSDKGFEGQFADVLSRLSRQERRTPRLPDRLSWLGQEVTDWDDATEAGFYWSDTGAVNGPFADRWQGQVTPMGGSLAGRTRQEVSIPTTGATGRVTWSRVYNGVSWSAWRRADNLMIPTACIGGTAAAQVDRSANFTPQTGRYNLQAGDKYFAMNGVFTGEFRAYEILFQWYTGDANGGGFRLRRLGADNATNNYNYTALYGSGGAAAAISGVTTQGSFPPASANGFFGSIVVTEPMYTAGTANQKRMRGNWGSFSNTQAAVVNCGMSGHDTTAFDGFSLYISDQSRPGNQAGADGWISVRGLM
jgi:hypothetical protein